jgi:hypothetical protein
MAAQNPPQQEPVLEVNSVTEEDVLQANQALIDEETK